MEIDRKTCFIFDLDGTVYLGDRPIPGTIDFIRRNLTRRNIFFLTNNTSKNLEEYVRKLSGFGIDVPLSEKTAPMIWEACNALLVTPDFGARSLGVEYNPDMVALARRNAQRAGVSGKASFINGDIFETDFTDASVVTMYLLPSLNLKLRDTLLKMKPGTRILSHAFTMGEWEPERTISTDDATGYFWIVPAQVAGRWAFEVGNERFAAEIGQQFQKLSVARGGPLKDGHVKGSTIHLVRANGQELVGELRGNQIVGSGWVATRIRSAG